MSPRDWKSLRSYRWYGPDDLRSFGHRSRAASMGCTQADYAGKPVIAILNTWSDINPCHGHLRERANDVKRGVWQAGGFPVEMPAFTLGETFQKPTTMMYRNLLAMEAEEMLRSYPADGCVLLGGCDKTTPALLMGAISMNLPAIYVPAGPMLRGNWHGEIFGSGSDVSKYWAERRAGIKLELDRFDQFSKKTPLLANLRPSGKYLMEDFYYAGGLPALLKALGPRLDLTCRTITGKTLGENISDAEIYNTDVIRTLDKPVLESGGLAILHGNLAPNGAVIKASAIEPRLLKHTGRAIVFDSYDEMNARIDDPLW